MKQNFVSLSALLFICTIIASCGGKEENKTEASKNELPTVNSEATNVNKSDSLNKNNSEEAAQNKPNEADVKKADALIKAYENAIASKVNLINNPSMNPDRAMQALDGVDTEIKNIENQINSVNLNDQQKAQYLKAKAKNKN